MNDTILQTVYLTYNKFSFKHSINKPGKIKRIEKKCKRNKKEIETKTEPTEVEENSSSIPHSESPPGTKKSTKNAP